MLRSYNVNYIGQNTWILYLAWLPWTWKIEQLLTLSLIDDHTAANFWSFITPRWCILLFIFCSKFGHMSNLYDQNPIFKTMGRFEIKTPLYVQFDQILPKIFEVKETWCHSFIFMLIDLTERKAIEIWTFCVKSNWLKHPRPFDDISKGHSCWCWYLWGWTEQFLEQIAQIYVILISNKSIIMKIKEWHHVS